MKTDKIVVVGGGSAGWMTAATLAKSFPDKDITVIESPNIPTVGVGESTLGQINRWFNLLEVTDDEWMSACDASYKLSIKFTDFYKKDDGFFHYPFGGPYSEGTESPIEDWHVVRHFYPELPKSSMIDMLFPAGALISEKTFSDNANGDLDNFDPDAGVAYHFDATKLGVWLRDEYCIPRGVKHLPKHISHVEANSKGVEWLELDDGTRVTADLFVDCTGFKSLLMTQAMNATFVPYDHVLHNDSAWAVQIPYADKTEELEPYTTCTAIGNGWCWNIPLWSRLGTGYVYSSKFISDEDALEEFKDYLCSDKMTSPRTREQLEQLNFRNIKMRVGIQERPWIGNVVCIGLSAGFIEPLESNGLFSVHEFLFLLVDILQREEINQFDRTMFNTESRDIFDGFAKFVALHYALSLRNDTPYWREIGETQYTESPELSWYPPHLHRQASFYTATRSFFDIFKNRNDLNGINYISVGMDYRLFNASRISALEFYVGKGRAKDKAVILYNEMTTRQSKWMAVAQKSEKLIDYLRNRFYTNE
jgi:tryptophan halogenase